MRRRQRKKLQELEKKRAARQEREAAAELERRIVYEVSFGPVTQKTLDEAHDLQAPEFIGSRIRSRALKRDGVLTAEGARLYAELLEAEKNEPT